MARARVTFDDRNLRLNVRSFGRRLDSAIATTVANEAPYATAHLRASAPWTDRTGAARSGLMAVANTLGPGSHELILSYSVYYGIYLETANSGKDAVIGPALSVLGQHVLANLRGIIDRLDTAQR